MRFPKGTSRPRTWGRSWRNALLDFVIFGTGLTQVFPGAALAGLCIAGLGMEVMSTGAACRTCNVLLAEVAGGRGADRGRLS